MQSATWVELLRLIPPALRENLALSISNGAEIALQSIVRADRDYLVIRGRLTGTTEGNGFFIIPFDRLNYLTFQKSVTEADMRALFGQSSQSPPPGGGEANSMQIDPYNTLVAQASLVLPGNGVPAAAAGSRTRTSEGSEGRPATVDKAALLERLRNRRPAPSGKPAGP